MNTPYIYVIFISTIIWIDNNNENGENKSNDTDNYNDYEKIKCRSRFRMHT